MNSLHSSAAAYADDSPHKPRASSSDLLRGLGYGSIAALAGLLGYAYLIILTGREFGPVALCVGWLVGTFVRKGANGLGGRRCQILAILLTYVAITFAYVPVGLRESAFMQSSYDATPLELALAIGTALAAALAAPIVNLASGLSGMLGIMIIGAGLAQAWSMTAADPRPLAGSFERGGAASVG